MTLRWDLCPLYLCTNSSEIQPLCQQPLFFFFNISSNSLSQPLEANRPAGCCKCDPVCLSFRTQQKSDMTIFIAVAILGAWWRFSLLVVEHWPCSSFTSPSKSVRLKPVIQIDSIGRKIKQRFSSIPNSLCYIAFKAINSMAPSFQGILCTSHWSHKCSWWLVCSWKKAWLGWRRVGRKRPDW